jgi:serine/threonine protein phosphatase PrpC
MEIRLFSISDVGLERETNEDMALVLDSLVRDSEVSVIKTISEEQMVAVADGMGGHFGGEIASQRVLDALISSFKNYKKNKNSSPEYMTVNTERWLKKEILAQHNSLNSLSSLSSRDLSEFDMGTTLTGVVISPFKELIAFHTGDSRLYIYNQRKLNQVTVDHTLRQETGRNIPSNILTNVIGAGFDECIVDVRNMSSQLKEGVILLLCTDGLHDLVCDNDILRLLNTGNSLEMKGRLLLKEALWAGGSDNITITLLEIVEIDTTI